MYAWWAFAGAFEVLYQKNSGTTPVLVPDHEAVIPCQTLKLKLDPVKAPPIPDLPDLLATGLSGEERRKETRLIKIAVGYNWLIGLTNKGHVLQLVGMRYGARIWHYVSESVCVLVPLSSCGAQLPHYSEIGKVRENPAFRPTTGDDGQKRPPRVELSSDTLLITHVSNTAPID